MLLLGEHVFFSLSAMVLALIFSGCADLSLNKKDVWCVAFDSLKELFDFFSQISTVKNGGVFTLPKKSTSS